jgi:hypothetical protein
MKSIGYIVPHLIHDLWDVYGVNVLKNVNSQNVFLMSMKNVAYKINNRSRNPLVASILYFDSQREERCWVNCEVRHGRRWRRRLAMEFFWRWERWMEFDDLLEMELEPTVDVVEEIQRRMPYG